jgi:hypothetical protein
MATLMFVETDKSQHSTRLIQENRSSTGLITLTEMGIWSWVISRDFAGGDITCLVPEDPLLSRNGSEKAEENRERPETGQAAGRPTVSRLPPNLT